MMTIKKEFKKCFNCGHEEVVEEGELLCTKCSSDLFYPVEADVYTFSEITEA